MIKIDFSTDADEEDPEKPDLIQIEVIEATSTLIEF